LAGECKKAGLQILSGFEVKKQQGNFGRKFPLNYELVFLKQMTGKLSLAKAKLIEKQFLLVSI
jgi:hypothetical protein